MEPVTVNCESACTVTHVIQHEIQLFQLTPEEGGAIAGAVLAVWAVGWAFRALIQTLRQTDGASSTNSED